MIVQAWRFDVLCWGRKWGNPRRGGVLSQGNLWVLGCSSPLSSLNLMPSIGWSFSRVFRKLIWLSHYLGTINVMVTRMFQFWATRVKRCHLTQGLTLSWELISKTKLDLWSRVFSRPLLIELLKKTSLERVQVKISFPLWNHAWWPKFISPDTREIDAGRWQVSG